jgi:hypothetical protein
MMPSAPTPADLCLWHSLEVLDEREAGTFVCRLGIHRNLIVEQTLEPSQVGAEPRKLRDLGFHGREVLPDESQHVLARSGALVPDCEDTSDVGKRDPECLRPVDEPEPLNRVFIV